MTMTKRQIVQHADAYVDWWTQRGMDMAACLTIDPKKWRPKHHSQVKKAVNAAFKKVGYVGSPEGVVEKGTDGEWHAHVVFRSGVIDPEALRSHWYFKHGRAMVRRAGQRSCSECHDRPNCSWKKYFDEKKRPTIAQRATDRGRAAGGGCGDLEYTARKMHLDRRDGGAIIGF